MSVVNAGLESPEEFVEGHFSDVICDGESLTYGDVYFGNSLLRDCCGDVLEAERRIRTDEETARPLIQWCACDVSIAVDVVKRVSPLRSAIHCSDKA